MQIETPRVPNFLRMSDGQTVPLCAVTDEGLRQLGAEFTEERLARAREQHRDTYGKERDAQSAPESQEAPPVALPPVK